MTAPHTELNGSVCRLIAAELALDSAQLLPATPLRAIAEDSLDAISLLVALEDRFGVVISRDQAAGLGTVGDLVEYVAAQQRHVR